jgi:hypothetical protein
MEWWADMNFAAWEVYPQGTEQTAKTDLAALLTLDKKGIQEHARFQRDWVEAYHSLECMAERFLAIYEEAIG